MGFQKKQAAEETEEQAIPVVPTTFNMRVDLKNKAKIYISMFNTKLDEQGKREGKLNLGLLLNEALDKYLEKIKIK